MPWTYATLLQAITDWAENPETTFQANLANIIRMAELRIAETIQLPSFRGTASGSLTHGVPTLAQPADFLAPYGFWLKDRAGIYSPILNKEAEFIRAAYPDLTYYTKPEYFSLTDDKLFALAPTPDWDYPYLLTYYRRPPSIVDNLTTWLGTNAEDVLFFAAMKNAAVFMKEEQDVIAMYDGLYQEAAYNLRVTGHGRMRKDWYRKPDRRKEVAAESTYPPTPQQGGQ